MEVSLERAEDWHLYRVHHFAQRPRVFTVRPPLDEMLTMTPDTWRATLDSANPSLGNQGGVLA